MRRPRLPKLCGRGSGGEHSPEAIERRKAIAEGRDPDKAVEAMRGNKVDAPPISSMKTFPNNEETTDDDDDDDDEDDEIEKFIVSCGDGNGA